jgi:hypothetical protein
VRLPGPFGEREFRYLVLGRVRSMLGTQMAPVGLVFAILALTGSKSDVGFVVAARSAPQELRRSVPQTVPASELQRANALLRLGVNAAMIVGPAVGGIVVAATLAVVPGALPLVLLGFPAPLAAIAAGTVVAGLGIEAFSVQWDTAMQQHVPREALSRVASYDLLGS